MSMTPAGAICDVCDNFILPIDPKERINLFGMPGIKNTMMCCNKCKKVLKKLHKDKNWKALPYGNLKRFIEKHEDMIETKDREAVKNG